MVQELRVVGIDIAKNVFHLVGMDERGQIILRKRVARCEVMTCVMLKYLADATALIFFRLGVR
jgi:hypothetical protein